MMLRFGRYGISNCSQYCGESGLARRRMWISTVFRGLCADILSFRGFLLALAVVAFARLDQRYVNRLVRKDRTLARVLRDRRLQKPLVVAVWKLGFVMRSTRLVAIQCAQRYHACQLEHVVEMPCVRQRHCGPQV